MESCVPIRQALCRTSMPIITPSSSSFDYWLTLKSIVPRVGFGTAALGQNRKELIGSAIRAGYRLFDTASDTGPWYRSEGSVGQSFKEAISRFEGDEAKKLDLKKKLLVETKMHPQDFSKKKAEESVLNSFRNAQRDHLDVYLLHYPDCGPADYKGLCPNRDGSEGDYHVAWAVLEDHFVKGEIGALGVANFDIRQLRDLIAKARHKPDIVQSWFDPYHQPWDLVRFCRENNIIFQSYSALGTQWAHRKETGYKNPILSDPVLSLIAKKYQKSIPQVVLRWLLQEDILIIPRSNSEAHIIDNAQLFDFDLSAQDIRQIRDLRR